MFSIMRVRGWVLLLNIIFYFGLLGYTINGDVTADITLLEFVTADAKYIAKLGRNGESKKLLMPRFLHYSKPNSEYFLLVTSSRFLLLDILNVIFSNYDHLSSVVLITSSNNTYHRHLSH